MFNDYLESFNFLESVAMSETLPGYLLPNHWNINQLLT